MLHKEIIIIVYRMFPLFQNSSFKNEFSTGESRDWLNLLYGIYHTIYSGVRQNKESIS